MKRRGPNLTLVRNDAPSARTPAALPPPSRETTLDEVSRDDLRVGDVIRVRLYEGLPGRIFAAPSQTLSGDAADLRIARIEDTTRKGIYFGPKPVRIVMSACGKCFTLDQEEYLRTADTPSPPITVEIRDVAPLKALPPPDPMRDVIDAEFYDPNDEGDNDDE